MSREQLMTRMMCSDAKVDLQALRTGALSQSDWDSLSEAMARLQSTSCYIDDTGGVTVSEMRTKLRRLKLELGRLDLVVIDYLQLMSYTGKSENRVQIVAEITRSLKMLARELDVPVVLLSQLSRAPEQRTDHRPMMSDLRESGSIEQDADVIVMLYRPAVYDPTAGNEAVAIVAKHRNGPTGMWSSSGTAASPLIKTFRTGNHDYHQKGARTMAELTDIQFIVMEDDDGNEMELQIADEFDFNGEHILALCPRKTQTRTRTRSASSFAAAMGTSLI